MCRSARRGRRHPPALEGAAAVHLPSSRKHANPRSARTPPTSDRTPGVALGRHGLPTASFVGTLSWIAIGAALAVACARVLGRFRASLIQRQDELAALSTRLISVQEEQLRRLSRELHDELGQSLTAVSSYLWLLERKLPPDLGELRTRASEARRLVAMTLGEMRELSQLLRPPGLDR